MLLAFPVQTLSPQLVCPPFLDALSSDTWGHSLPPGHFPRHLLSELHTRGAMLQPHASLASSPCILGFADRGYRL